jgi:hypothetical protein
MPRQAIPLAIADVSALSRALETQLAQLGRAPRHLELMNMLARGAGYGNFQHLRAIALGGEAPPPQASRPLLAPVPRLDGVDRAAGYFDGVGMLMSWPAKPKHQLLCLWVLWSRIPARQSFTEIGFSRLLDLWHRFGDAALIRRELWGRGMIYRTPLGADYRRIEQPPPAELKPLLERIAGKMAGAA